MTWKLTLPRGKTDRVECKQSIVTERNHLENSISFSKRIPKDFKNEKKDTFDDPRSFGSWNTMYSLGIFSPLNTSVFFFLNLGNYSVLFRICFFLPASWADMRCYYLTGFRWGNMGLGGGVEEDKVMSSLCGPRRNIIKVTHAWEVPRRTDREPKHVPMCCVLFFTPTRHEPSFFSQSLPSWRGQSYGVKGLNFSCQLFAKSRTILFSNLWLFRNKAFYIMWSFLLLITPVYRSPFKEAETQPPSLSFLTPLNS